MKSKNILLMIALTSSLVLSSCGERNKQMHVDGMDYLHKDLNEEFEQFVFETKGTLTVHKYSTKQLEQMATATRTSFGVHSASSEENEALAEALETSSFRIPVDGAKYTSKFGARWGRMHEGSDFAAPTGTPIYSIGSGVVSTIGGHETMGNYAIIDTKMGGKDYTVIYMHMNKRASVTIGDVVTNETKIGEVGSTGNSTGPHLHLEIHGDDPDKSIINSMISGADLTMAKTKTWYTQTYSKLDPAYFFPMLRGEAPASQKVSR